MLNCQAPWACDDIFINNLRLIECGHDTNIAFHLVYPADLQKVSACPESDNKLIIPEALCFRDRTFSTSFLYCSLSVSSPD